MRRNGNKRNKRSFLRPPLEPLALLKYRREHQQRTLGIADRDFFENARGSQRVKGLKDESTIKPWKRSYRSWKTGGRKVRV